MGRQSRAASRKNTGRQQRAAKSSSASSVSSGGAASEPRILSNNRNGNGSAGGGGGPSGGGGGGSNSPRRPPQYDTVEEENDSDRKDRAARRLALEKAVDQLSTEASVLLHRAATDHPQRTSIGITLAKGVPTRSRTPGRPTTPASERSRREELQARSRHALHDAERLQREVARLECEAR